MAAGVLDDTERLAHLLGSGLERHASYSGADGDDAHGVGDHVVQFAGYVHAFVGAGTPSPLFALAFAGIVSVALIKRVEKRLAPWRTDTQ